MFSHIVIFWTRPELPDASEQLLAGIDRFLKPIPGIVHLHAGRMVASERPIVDSSYQIGLNLVFESKQAESDYQVHPSHIEFVETVFKKLCSKAVIYDFE